MVKCPGCKQAIARLSIENVVGANQFSNQFTLSAFKCPMCHTIVSVGIDPYTMKTELLKEIQAMMQTQLAKTSQQYVGR